MPDQFNTRGLIVSSLFNTMLGEQVQQTNNLNMLIEHQSKHEIVSITQKSGIYIYTHTFIYIYM
jgi:hypothetical protein